MNATETIGRPESYLIAMDESIFKKKIELASRMMEKGVQSDKELADSFDSDMDEGGTVVEYGNGFKTYESAKVHGIGAGLDAYFTGAGLLSKNKDLCTG